MKRARGLKVIGTDTDHVVDFQVSSAPRPPRKIKHRSGNSPEIQRDSAIEVEPANMTALPIDDNRRRSWLAYRTARTLAGSYEPVTSVPPTRGDCPTERPCVHLRCVYSLYREDEPAGRPGLSDCPRNAHGYTVSHGGDLGGENQPRIDPRAPWLRHPLPPSCALDVADEGIHDNLSLGLVMSKHRTLVARLVVRACRSLAERGVAAADLERLIDPQAANDREHESAPSRIAKRRA